MKYLERLNPQQREAVECTEGPLLILAGAGSGKTRVLTCRIAYLIEQKNVRPWNIMAITFTNKAAGEMRERVDALVGEGAEDIWVSTFHSSCCRILRRFIDRLGYERNFAIYDTDDSRQVMKAVLKQLELDPKIYKERSVLAKISSAKNEMMDPDDFEAGAESWSDRNIARCYREYQKQLVKNNALDFDDLLIKTVELFRQEPEVLQYYQERFRYIMIDEYQDTNSVQFAFVELLASRYRNLCVVGDDDQSIYKFRGANIQNILNFEKVFPGAKVIKLEQNYRSTEYILQAANEVIANNVGRKQKRLWTENKGGNKIHFRNFNNAYEEAEFVAEDIGRKVRNGASYQDFAILYRTNAMSRLFEERFITANIPYKLVGGVNFYARKEIKDLLAYLKTIDNGVDNLAVERIINIPKRGIGQTTIGKVETFALENGMSFYDALLIVDQIPGLSRAAAKIAGFTAMIGKYRGMAAEGYSVRQILEVIITDTGYVKALEEEGTDEAKARIENIDELISKTEDYEESTDDPSLSDFLQQVSLVADIDSVEDGGAYVLLMTLHSAKGLEFDNVYLTGMEENTFPSYLSVSAGDNEELEEERRLCYVGITRAKRDLTLTACQMRMVRGETQYLRASRFIREIPEELLELERDTTDTRRFMSAPAAEEKMFGEPSYGSAGYRNPVNTQIRPRKSLRTDPRFNPNAYKVQKLDSLDYGIGDQVRHIKFGVGTVQEVKKGEKDFEVTVDFEKAGVKRMFASFAKLKKV
ncbi:MAG: DNA helicase PcrA [Eubacteriales bacterium]|nr:DNA helicase PcrA [Eubacteriales bacterium]